MKRNRKMSIAASVFYLVLLSSQSFGEINADNTKLNQRDRASDELTADQQKANKSDTQITRRIRQDIMKDKDLSTYAHNIKIIAVNGKVTLKGPVRSENEENKILKCARSVAGASNVNNEIEIVQK